jgi:plasmid stabilization system protein ParE
VKCYSIKIKPTAEADLTQRFQQIAEESHQNAVQWYLSLISAIESLDKLAQRCPIAPEDQDIQCGIRHLVLGRYRVLFCIEGDDVHILHIRHSRHDRVL